MSDLPTIAILFMTKEVPGREGIAVQTIEAIKENMSYEGPYVWFFACGLSSEEYKQTLMQALGSTEMGWWHMSDDSPGYVWNNGIENIFDSGGPIYLRMEDDMVLHDKLDITPYVKLLMEKKRVGMVRLGLMPIGLDLHSTAHDVRIYFNVKNSTPYKYSGNPGLIHKRLHDAHGYFDETMNPGEIEVNFDHRIRNEQGPEIWMPAELCKHTYGYFHHIGEVQSYE